MRHRRACSRQHDNEAEGDDRLVVIVKNCDAISYRHRHAAVSSGVVGDGWHRQYKPELL